MFTGLISAVGTVRSVGRRQHVVRIEIEVGTERFWDGALRIGDSVAADGVCLSVVAHTGNSFEVEAVPETAAKTTVAHWRPGRAVNLERALRVGDRLDGHWVAGHVDATAEVVAVHREGDARRIQFACPAHLGKYITEKGSVALDGVSLTVAECPASDRFVVAVIPETLRATHWRDLKAGARVNMEVDLLARYLDRLRRSDGGSGRLNWADLHNAGF